MNIAGTIIPAANTITETIDLIHSSNNIDNKQADIINAQAIDELKKEIEMLKAQQNK